MRRMATFIAVGALLVGGLGAPSAGQAPVDQTERERRLQALRPSNPMAYFELAEEIAYEAQTEEEEDLARRLYVLAFELDRRTAPVELGASACLGIRELSKNSVERQWLAALARAVDSEPSRIDWPLDVGGQDDAAESYLLAEAMGRHRAGDYRRATLGLDNDGARGVVDELPEHHVRVIDRSINHARNTPACRSCKRRRIISTGPETRARLCTACDGDPGPEFDLTALAEHVAVEAVLLDASPPNWSAQLLIMDGVPIRDFDASELARVYRVDPALSVWRDRRWRAPEAP